MIPITLSNSSSAAEKLDLASDSSVETLPKSSLVRSSSRVTFWRSSLRLLHWSLSTLLRRRACFCSSLSAKDFVGLATTAALEGLPALGEDGVEIKPVNEKIEFKLAITLPLLSISFTSTAAWAGSGSESGRPEPSKSSRSSSSFFSDSINWFNITVMHSPICLHWLKWMSSDGVKWRNLLLEDIFSWFKIILSSLWMSSRSFLCLFAFLSISAIVLLSCSNWTDKFFSCFCSEANFSRINFNSLSVSLNLADRRPFSSSLTFNLLAIEESVAEDCEGDEAVSLRCRWRVCLSKMAFFWLLSISMFCWASSSAFSSCLFFISSASNWAFVRIFSSFIGLFWSDMTSNSNDWKEVSLLGSSLFSGCSQRDADGAIVSGIETTSSVLSW